MRKTLREFIEELEDLAKTYDDTLAIYKFAADRAPVAKYVNIGNVRIEIS